MRIVAFPGNDGLTGAGGPTARQERSNPVHFEPMQSVNDPADHAIVRPGHQEESRGAVPEVMFSGALPQEMPRIPRINAQDSFAVAVDSAKRASIGFCVAPFAINDRIGVLSAGPAGCKANPVDAPVIRSQNPATAIERLPCLSELSFHARTSS